jgi:hypothetical protein
MRMRPSATSRYVNSVSNSYDSAFIETTMVSRSAAHSPRAITPAIKSFHDDRLSRRSEHQIGVDLQPARHARAAV